MASSSGSGSSELMSLEELPMGVVLRFQPTDAQLVLYLYNQIMLGHAGNGKQAFPENDIYGKNGLVRWVIWDSSQDQDFLYFFTRVKKQMGSKGKRLSRTVGCGGIWTTETEAAKPVYFDGIQGRLRKFWYENKNKSFEHQTAWIMEEFSIEHDVIHRVFY